MVRRASANGRLRRGAIICAAVIGAAVLAFVGATLAWAATTPTAAFTYSPPTPTAGDTVTFTNGSQTDPTSTLAHLEYWWNFGTDTTADANPTHVYTDPGVYTASLVAYQVQEDSGTTSTVGSATTSAAITVAAPPPAGPAPDSYDSGRAGQLVIDAPGVLANDNPTASQTGSLTAVAQTAAETAEGGSVDVNADGSFVYTPPSDTFIGDDTFTYKTADVTGLQSGEVSVTVTVKGIVAVDDAYDVSSTGETVISPDIGVLENDSNNLDANLTAALAQTPPSHGELSLDANGGFTYTPTDSGYTGTDTFTYVAQGGDATSNEATVTLTLAAPATAPANDDAVNAESIDSAAGRVDGTTAGATLETEEPTPWDTSGAGQTVWYRWTAPSTGTVDFTITLESDFSALLAAYPDSDGLPSSEYLANGYPLEFDVEADTSYLIQVAVDDSEGGPFTLSWSLDGASESPPPANDDFADASALPSQATGSVTGTNDGATTEESEPLDPDLEPHETVWWKWVAPTTDTYRFDTNGSTSGESGLDTVMSVYTGSDLSALSTVASNDDDPTSDDDTSRVTFPAAQGTTYYIQVGSWSDAPTGMIHLNWAQSAAQNDMFAAAEGLEGDSGSVDGTTVDATLEAQEPSPPYDTDTDPLDNTVWYAWTPSTGGSANLTLSSQFTGSVAVYQGADLQSLEDLSDGHGSEFAVPFDAQANTTYYVQVGTYSDSPGAFTLGWSVTAATRTIDGSVRTGDGSAAPGVLVRACNNGSCTDATTNSDGVYSVSGLDPAVYTVSAYPADRSTLAVQTSADVTAADATGVDLRFAAGATGSTADGPTTFTVAGCAGGTLHYTVAADGSTLGGGDVSGPNGTYVIDISALAVGHRATLELDYTITCPDTADQTGTALLFADPSGTVVDDGAGGAALADATVTLLDSAGNAIPAHDARLSSATGDNPETSDPRGGWGWDVAPGTYRVRAEKDNCGTTTSGNLTVTSSNPATGVVLHLSCTTPTTPTPPPSSGGGGGPAPPPVFPPPAPPLPPLPPPVKGVSVNAVPAVGVVLLNGAPMPVGVQIPYGSVLDTTNGIVGITAVGPDGTLQTAYFFGGVFQVVYGADGATELILQQGDFDVCTVPSAAKRTTSSAGTHASVAARVKPTKKSSKVIRAVWGTGTGSFRTRGRYSAATVRGTLWYTADRCDGTFIKVDQGLITVDDLERNLTLTLAAGHSLLVRPKNG